MCAGAVVSFDKVSTIQTKLTKTLRDDRVPRLKAWLLFLLLGSLAAPAGAAQSVFPSLTAYNLNKDKVTLPSGMEGKTDLLLISFAPEQQKELESWLPAAQALQHTNFQFHYYELPVEGRENFVFRWWETSSLRDEEDDPESWPWIVPLFVDRVKLMRALNIPDAKQVVALLVDRQGKILWRASGPMTTEQRASLMAAAQ